MRPNIENYLFAGRPAAAYVTFKKVPTAGKVIVVNGVSYAYGTDFMSRGLSPNDVAEAFASAVNGQPEGYGTWHSKLNPFADVFAIYYGATVGLFAMLPGTAGNSYTLTTDESTSMTVSGATFTGGAAGAAGELVTTPAFGTAAGGVLVATTAAAASLVIKNAAGTLISLIGVNNKATEQYIQVHDAASLPADAAVPKYSIPVPGTTPFSLDIPIIGAPFATGITVCNSSTLATKTVGSADCWFTAVRI